MSENTESIQIHELDEHGARVAAAEIEEELAKSASVNPWLIALWVFNGLLVLLSILSFVGFIQNSIPSYLADELSGNLTPSPRISWLSLLGPYAIAFAIFAVLSILGTLITHAMIWERRRRA
ncbi:hypothetical protein [Psychromicrobium lacuslunae]|uniref:Uncharacterized protein n=1 Tax=Psychromicrobium lacuslunae TaxID=1618207 RepID=A0A0D4C192_9MICC|nr:hypothetical protein [Psychromicrobium lacuslunae]AJT42462.1 hypothetical protein UM93_14910 [Psychromicrobium lacuslunae]